MRVQLKYFKIFSLSYRGVPGFTAGEDTLISHKNNPETMFPLNKILLRDLSICRSHTDI